MPLGDADKQYDLSWQEQDKVRRRIALKARLKAEGVRKRYDPFLQLKGIIFTDPSIDRYMDLRKKGRMPGTPFKPKLFFGMLSTILIPMVVFKLVLDWETIPYREKLASGEIPYKDRNQKVMCGVTGW